jgi:hypothetical protein
VEAIGSTQPVKRVAESLEARSVISDSESGRQMCRICHEKCNMSWIKKLAGLVLVGAIMALVSTSALRSLQSPAQQIAPQATSSGSGVLYTPYNLATSLVHTVRVVPGDDYTGDDYAVELALDSGLAPLNQFVEQHHPVAALNGGFFDPQNQQSTSYIVQQGQLVGDPRQNMRLMENPDLTPYLDKILDRSEFRRYRCGSQFRYGITPHHEPVPPECELLDVLGAGPQLLPELTLEQEGFTATDSAGNLIRDVLGSRQPNARSAIGILPDGSLLLVMAAQKPGMAASGLSLSELALFMQNQGVKVALNLDGGSSSALFSGDQLYYGKLDANDQPVVRPVKSVLLVNRKP